jgi:ATP adenylyltransferase
MKVGKGRGSLLLEAGTLWESLTARTARAQSTGALQPIPTSFEFVEEGGVRFLVRVLSNLARKDEERWRREREAGAGREVNPFLPCEEELFVGDLTDTHRCLLNKFNVVAHHLLIVTRLFEEQDDYLTDSDFTAMLIGLAEYASLAFYNGGVVAGASQRHKHLQLVPLPLAAEGPRVPIDPVIGKVRYEGKIGTSPAFPFVHVVAPVDPHWIRFPLESGEAMRRAFHLMLRAVGMESGEDPLSERQKGPYNFIATREWMLLVPRSEEFFDGTSVNSLGFAGALLVRSREEMERLKARGPMTALRGVAVPRPSSGEGRHP